MKMKIVIGSDHAGFSRNSAAQPRRLNCRRFRGASCRFRNICCTALSHSVPAQVGAVQNRIRKTRNRKRFGEREPMASDIEIAAQEVLKIKNELYEIISKHSGQTFDKVYEDSDRDYWMKAPEAKEYGMIDEILVREKS